MIESKKVVEEDPVRLDDLEFTKTLFAGGIDEFKVALAEILNIDDPVDSAGDTALHYAAKSGNLDKIRLVLERGASLNLRTYNKKLTPLHVAVINDHAEAVECLVQHGADVEARANDGLTPLHMAAVRNSASAAKALLNKGANVLATEANGATALHGAAFHGHAEVAQVLVDAGANAEAMDRSGNTPTQLARANGRASLVALFEASSKGAVSERSIIVPAIGVGAIRLGATSAAEVERLLGKPGETLRDDRDAFKISMYYQELGLQISCEDGTVRSILVYGETEGYKAFPGHTVEGVSTKLTRREVEEILGKPENTREGKLFGPGSDGKILKTNCSALHSNGLRISYDTHNGMDMDARIASMFVWAYHDTTIQKHLRWTDGPVKLRDIVLDPASQYEAQFSTGGSGFGIKRALRFATDDQAKPTDFRDLLSTETYTLFLDYYNVDFLKNIQTGDVMVGTRRTMLMADGT